MQRAYEDVFGVVPRAVIACAPQCRPPARPVGQRHAAHMVGQRLKTLVRGQGIRGAGRIQDEERIEH